MTQDEDDGGGDAHALPALRERGAGGAAGARGLPGALQPRGAGHHVLPHLCLRHHLRAAAAGLRVPLQAHGAVDPPAVRLPVHVPRPHGLHLRRGLHGLRHGGLAALLRGLPHVRQRRAEPAHHALPPAVPRGLAGHGHGPHDDLPPRRRGDGDAAASARRPGLQGGGLRAARGGGAPGVHGQGMIATVLQRTLTGRQC
ncbi:hypothetical protein ON010_g1424 [Phytophthora cinnamomi]|nr:hypothetical protein ON010_g1424 [Phytophthora cinnamomi]